MQNIIDTQRNIRDLAATIRYHETRIDMAANDLDRESHERMANVAERLLEEQQDILDRLQSNAAREAAEARLAYHVENDTLDLY